VVVVPRHRLFCNPAVEHAASSAARNLCNKSPAETIRVRLPEFIDRNEATILAEWVTFARSCGPEASAMDLAALRDHAAELLRAIAKDLRQAQSGAEETEKSKGEEPRDESSGSVVTVAGKHGAGRADVGFSLAHMVAEYRALRGSVIRLWTAEQGSLGPPEIADLTRFNEAIDQALAESVTSFESQVAQSRDMFVAILGHDLQTPLGAVITSAQFILDADALAEPYATVASVLTRSARRMSRLVDELLDFTRIRLGTTFPIDTRRCNMESVARDAIQEMLAAHPERSIELDARGDVWGTWDPPRIRQVIGNLLANSVQYGSRDSAIRVSLEGADEAIELSVHNDGAPISPGDLGQLFDPLKRFAAGQAKTSNLGLGLYIAERIVAAHGGTIEVASTATDGTTFTVHLPRQLPNAEACSGQAT
jgi:signal transduction histidine kinase